MTMPPTLDPDDTTPVFPIAVAAELAGMHPQTLRQYDRLGLVVPARTAGRVRRYSLSDIARLREIAELSEEGLGLEGILRVLRLREEVQLLRRRVRELEGELAEARTRSGQSRRVFSAGEHSVVAMMLGERPRRGEIVRWTPHPLRADLVTGTEYRVRIDYDIEDDTQDAGDTDTPRERNGNASRDRNH
ncbi:heat shock protein transcriptional repressor HspR [Gulosibacter bifidus]|uniref:Heat shock protein transcriptional repressor HspR n=1 Tax=Gulosibacter bifidus TaxID=272239 RepID=A0ABW5RJE6_9MICO